MIYHPLNSYKTIRLKAEAPAAMLFPAIQFDFKAPIDFVEEPFTLYNGHYLNAMHVLGKMLFHINDLLNDQLNDYVNELIIV